LKTTGFIFHFISEKKPCPCCMTALKIENEQVIENLYLERESERVTFILYKF